MEFCGVSEGDQEIHQFENDDWKEPSKRPPTDYVPQRSAKKPCPGPSPQARTSDTSAPSPPPDWPMSSEPPLPTFALHASVQLCGLEEKRHLNGLRGRVSLPVGAEVVGVLLRDGSKLNLNIRNLLFVPDPVLSQPGVFWPGDTVRLHGLAQRHDLNQAWGTVSSPHAGANAKRITVRLDSGNVVAVPISNLIHAPVRANGSDEDVRSNAPDTYCASNTNPGWGMTPPAKLDDAELEALDNQIRDFCQKTPQELVDIMRANLRPGETLVDPLAGKNLEEILLVVCGTYATMKCLGLASLVEAHEVGGIITLQSGGSLTKAVSLTFLNTATKADGTPAIASAQDRNLNLAPQIVVIDVLAGNWNSGREINVMFADLKGNRAYAVAAIVLEVMLLVNSRQCVLRVMGALNRQLFGGWVRLRVLDLLDPEGKAAGRILEEKHTQCYQDTKYIRGTTWANSVIHDHHNQVVGQLLVGAALSRSRVGKALYVILSCKRFALQRALEVAIQASADPERGMQVLGEIVELASDTQVSHQGVLSTAALD